MRLIALLCLILITSCGQSTSNLHDEFSGSEFQYYDRGDRTKMASNLYDAVDLLYAPLEVKKQRIGLDLDNELYSALADEANFEDSDNASEQAELNLAFIDRMKMRIARFQDTHFKLRMENPVNRVSNGLSIREVDGRFFVVRIKPKIMKYNDMTSETQQFSKISIGDEVVSINGQQVEQAVQNLIPFRNASSRLSARIDAVYNLTSRNFSLPQKNSAAWGIKNSNGEESIYDLPWFVKLISVADGAAGIDSARMDASKYFNDRDFAAIHDIRTKLSEDEGVPPLEWQLPSVGYRSSDQLSGMVEVEEYKTNDEIILRTGVIKSGDETFAVMQLFSFNEYSISKDGEPFDIVEVMRAFLKTANSRELPLMLDLRNNGGGDPVLSDTLLSLLTEKDKVYAPHSVSFRLTQQVRAVVESSTMFGSDFDPDNYLLMPAAHAAIKEAALARQSHTSVLASKINIVADEGVGGFEMPIVVLTTPDCVSACDIAVMNISANARATIIGTHTNGTGAGFRATSMVPTAEYHEPRGLLFLRFPNFLFGAPGAVGDLIDRSEGAAIRRSSENIPTQADVEHLDTLNDYMNQGADWVSKAVQVLRGNSSTSM